MGEFKKIDWEAVSFQIISYSGEAKSLGMMAINKAKANDIVAAKKSIQEAHEAIVKAEQAHLEVIQQEANGIQHDFKVLFMHAEDQMLTAQTTIDLADEIIDLYKTIFSQKK